MSLVKPADAHRHGNLREAVLELGLRAAASGSLEAMSLRQMSRTLGVSPGAVYRHYTGKDDLLCAIAQKGFDRLADAFAKVLPWDTRAATPSDARNRFEALCAAYIRFSKDHYDLWRLMFGRHGFVATSPLEHRPATYAWLKKSLEELRDTDLIRPFSVEDQFFVWSVVHGLADLQASPAVRTDELEEALDDHCGRIIRALA